MPATKKSVILLIFPFLCYFLPFLALIMLFSFFCLYLTYNDYGGLKQCFASVFFSGSGLTEILFCRYLVFRLQIKVFRMSFFTYEFSMINLVFKNGYRTGIPLNPLNVLACAFARPKWELCGALVSHSIMLCFAAKRPVSQLSAYRSNLSGTV